MPSREFGKVCPATDLYALGHIAYEMALGSKVYRKQFPAVFEGTGSGKEANPGARWMAWHCSLPTKADPIHEIQKEFPRQLSDIINTELGLMAKPLSERMAAPANSLSCNWRSNQPVAVVVSGAAGADRTRSCRASREPPAVVASTGRQSRTRRSRRLRSGVMYYVQCCAAGKAAPFDLATLCSATRQGQDLAVAPGYPADGTAWLPTSSVEGLF